MEAITVDEMTTGGTQDNRPDGEERLSHIPVALVDRNPYQPRTVFNEVALQELVASILEHGVLQPIIVRRNGNRFQLVSGERRLQASKRAGLARVPAVIHEYDDLRMLEIAIVENIQREDISPLEAAEAYKRLMDEFSLTQEQVALRVGKSRPAVSNTLRLLKLPPQIRESLARGDISEGHARTLLSIADPEWQERVWRRIVEDNLSVRDTERLSGADKPAARDEEDNAPTSPKQRVSRETKETAPPHRQDPHLAALEDRLRLYLGTRVRIRGTEQSGTIAIDYFSADDLQRLVNLLGVM